MYETADNRVNKTNSTEVAQRKSTQPVLPQWVSPADQNGNYNLYPYSPLGTGKIYNGYESLAAWMTEYPCVIMDGFSGIFWQEVQQCLEMEFSKKDVSVQWIDITRYLKSETAIQEMVAPFLGTTNSVWGTKCRYALKDLFHIDKLLQQQPGKGHDLVIAYGPGAALLPWKAPVVYLDIPKNEIQYRMRAGSVTNLGCTVTDTPAEMYKRYYFVDWVLLAEHKKNILNRVTVLADVQWQESLNWMLYDDLKPALHQLAQSVFRVRPWFEPGAWGGQWMKEKLPGLNTREVNYAWSFELIVPENGLIFESDGWLLETAFDILMFTDHKAVLGKHADRFGYEFPIRFDFLDTWNGGNLSVQCHPRVDYIREQFGENITQDETYYIMDCRDDAQVYLGFRETIDPQQFRQELENSRDKNVAVDISKHVMVHKAHKHDLFLIPNGTIHSAGANNLVLEISATPYIFTFKMYDWLRLDLNGEPRAINIDHAYNNLYFDRKGQKVIDELLSKPCVIEKSSDRELVHLPTHKEHFYDVHRVEFDNTVTIQTNESCHVLMLVEGSSVLVKTADGRETEFHFAETFVIPAAAKEYTLINKGTGRAKVVKAFIKDSLNK